MSKKIEKLKEVNETLRKILNTLEAQIFIETRLNEVSKVSNDYIFAPNNNKNIKPIYNKNN